MYNFEVTVHTVRNYGWTVTFYGAVLETAGDFGTGGGSAHLGGRLLRDSKALEKNLVRLHVVANSDSQEDQDLKLQVRDAIVQQLNGVMGELDSAQAAKAFLTEHLGNCKRQPTGSLQEAGFPSEGPGESGSGGVSHPGV